MQLDKACYLNTEYKRIERRQKIKTMVSMIEICNSWSLMRFPTALSNRPFTLARPSCPNPHVYILAHESLIALLIAHKPSPPFTNPPLGI